MTIGKFLVLTPIAIVCILVYAVCRFVKYIVQMLILPVRVMRGAIKARRDRHEQKT